MATKKTSTLALFCLLNILLSSSVNACGGGGCPTPPNPTPNCPPTPTPNPISPPFAPPPPSAGTCPIDALKLGVCANVLSLVGLTIGSPPVQPCCSLIEGLVDLEVAVCLCIAIRANILGINLNVPLSLSLVLNACDRQVPNGFQCP